MCILKQHDSTKTLVGLTSIVRILWQCYLYRTTSSLLFVVNVVYILKQREFTKIVVDLTWRLGDITPNSLRIRARKVQRWEPPNQIIFQHTYFLLYSAKTKKDPFLILHCTRNPNTEGNQTLLLFSLSLSRTHIHTLAHDYLIY